MKRQGFILTEILTGMMLQVGFAIVLCSAFYMILSFSTTAQQGFAANDKGQMVITYFDSRIRGAGLGMWKCHGSSDIRAAFPKIPALDDNTLCLPVAIVSSADGKTKVSYDKKTGVYSGNVVTLLYAHKDPNDVRLILSTGKAQSMRTVTKSTSNANNQFDLIDKATRTTGNGTKGISSYTNSEFNKGVDEKTNINRYAVMESSGIPVYTIALTSTSDKKVGLRAPTDAGVKVYPMSELLNIECQKLYTKKDDNGYNFVFMPLNDQGWGQAFYHTKDILDLYMTLNTKPNTPDRVPIFELRVLVNEGINENGSTPRPKDWPGRWKNTGFDQYKVRVSKATWKLYNLVPQFR